jgi:heterodisulfide reductase subunit A
VAGCAFGAIRLDEHPSRREVTAGAIVLATGLRPGDVDGPEGLVSSFALERMLHPDGPTKGEVRGAGAHAPRSVLLATTAAEEDGALAVEEVLKLARRLRAALPAAHVAVAGGLARAPNLARRAAALSDLGVELLDGQLVPGAVAAGAGGLEVRIAEGGGERVLAVDLVVVHGPSRGAGGDLARRLRLATDARGFVAERGASPFEPTATRLAGVYVAGAAAGPRTIAEAIRDGAAAAGLVLSSLVPGERKAIEPLAAEIESAVCGGCGVCVAACPFGAVALGPDGKAHVEALHCRGCGTCAAGCPTGAASARHFTRAQLRAEISALLADAAGERW